MSINKIITLFRFLADKRRLNVALTRAKCALYVVGHFQSLQVGIVETHMTLEPLHWTWCCGAVVAYIIPRLILIKDPFNFDEFNYIIVYLKIIIMKEAVQRGDN